MSSSHNKDKRLCIAIYVWWVICCGVCRIRPWNCSSVNGVLRNGAGNLLMRTEFRGWTKAFSFLFPLQLRVSLEYSM
jgi:hypothetical protein